MNKRPRMVSVCVQKVYRYIPPLILPSSRNNPGHCSPTPTPSDTQYIGTVVLVVFCVCFCGLVFSREFMTDFRVNQPKGNRQQMNNSRQGEEGPQKKNEKVRVPDINFCCLFYSTFQSIRCVIESDVYKHHRIYQLRGKKMRVRPLTGLHSSGSHSEPPSESRYFSPQ